MFFVLCQINNPLKSYNKESYHKFIDEVTEVLRRLTY